MVLADRTTQDDALTTKVAAVATSILLVEDDDACADFVLDAFADAPGMGRVTRVARLQDALHQLATIAVDVVLLDLTLPDAFDLLGVNAIRNAAPEVALVVLTGSLDAALSARVTAAGADDYLQKGDLDANLLVRSISYARDRRACMYDANEETPKLEPDGSDSPDASLDVDTMMAAVAAAALPKFAAWCAVQIRSEHDNLVHRAQVGQPPVESVRVEQIEQVMESGIPSPRGTTTLVVPLVIRGRVRGTLQLGRTDDAPRFLDEDLELATELARRAALMFESARLYNASQATIAHRAVFRFITSQELRKPLSRLQIQIDRMQRTVQTTKDTIGPVRQAMTRLKVLATKLSQITAGNVVVDAGEMDLAELAVEVVHRHRGELKEDSTVGLRLHVTTRAVGIWDRLLLENLMTSLLDHADKYGGSKSIEVSVVTEADIATLSVRDHGAGIHARDLARIFDRFELHVSRQIVEAHGGAIDVESELGKGSSVTVRLPCRPPGPRPASDATA